MKTMKVLVAHAGGDALKKMAETVASGAKELNMEVSVVVLDKPIQDAAAFDFVFIGLKLALPDASVQKLFEALRGKPIAFFFVAQKPDKQAVDATVAAASQKGAFVKNTFTASLKGVLSFLGLGSVKEDDLIRARGFCERTLNNVFGLPFGGDNEKARIKGYLK